MKRPTIILASFIMLIPTVEGLIDRQAQLANFDGASYLARGEVKLGLYLKETAGKTASIAVTDVGAIPYFSELRTLDILGLNHAGIAKASGGLANKDFHLTFWTEKIDYIQLHTTTSESGVRIPSSHSHAIRLFYSQKFQREFELDAAAPVPILYQRRTTPKAASWWKNWRQVSVQFAGSLKDPQIILTNTGNGCWYSNPTSASPAFFKVHTTWLLNGEVHYNPQMELPQDLKAGENVILELPPPKKKAKNTLLLVNLYVPALGLLWEEPKVIQFENQ